MTLKWYRSQSMDRPLELDMDSSPTTVFMRKNIEEVEKEDTEGQTYTEYEYDEAKLSKEEYAIHQAEVNAANIDFIAIMTGVDIDE